MYWPQACSRLSPPIGHDIVDKRPAANATTTTVATMATAPTLCADFPIVVPPLQFKCHKQKIAAAAAAVLMFGRYSSSRSTCFGIHPGGTMGALGASPSSAAPLSA